MRLNTRAKDEPEVNVVSLVDVLLVLVLFFMVSTTFNREAEIRLKLPEAEAASAAADAVEALEITVTEAGGYLVNGRPLVNSERRVLRAAIEQTVGEQRGLPVFVRADAQATHQAVVTAMDVAGQLGFVEINIATVTTPEP